MTYELFLGDRSFSSWSLRGWLMCEGFGLPHRDTFVGLYSGTMARDLAPLAPARTVPVLRSPSGAVLTDSLAMAETLAEENPEAGLWPADPAARGLARSMVAEMHSGFGALRGACPMFLRHGWTGFDPAPEVIADVGRVQALWSLARDRHGADGPWLFDRYSLADVFYAPVATRIATYDLPVDAGSASYVHAALTEPNLVAWRAAGQAVAYHPLPYANLPAVRGLGTLPWEAAVARYA
ncbi:glutathione S-transferase [Wenxinia saemankumensis]|uniref:Glutathione S-transferase n=1 Tax=Wenxinia saemankumensis TaxID=1447782 RepID=A0A1M6FHN5_9RHOB|nr:glutathione S-transferase [Wenxinia saemankumensis]SHI97261.1 glutathione S-transferase [Wenxinia saemankumensis]